MTRILLAVASISVMGYLAYREMYHRRTAAGGEQTAHQQLENVRGAATRIEAQGAQRAAEAVEKSVQLEQK